MSHFVTKTTVAHPGPRGPASKDGTSITFTVAEENFAHGTFGIVFEGNLKPNNEKVAIKKVFQDPNYRNRELEIIKALDHRNIVELKYHFFEKIGSDKFLFLIMEYVPQSLYRVIRRLSLRKRYTPMIYVRVVMFQLFRALAYVHSLHICHRDIKPHNILMDPRTAMTKLCDFGSAKQLRAGETNVYYICSRFYRSPDLMFGREDYGFEVDMWAAGCVMAEMINNSVLFLGESRADQIAQIINTLGTPSKAEMKAMSPEYVDLELPQVAKRDWADVFHRSVPKEAIALLGDILRYSPYERLTAYEALSTDFFEPLRNPETLLPGDEQLPELFDWTAHEISQMPESLRPSLVRAPIEASVNRARSKTR